MKRQLELNFENKENLTVNNNIKNSEKNTESNKYDESAPYAFAAVILIIASILF